MVELDEADAVFDHAAGEEAHLPESLGVVVIHAVEGFDVLWLLGHVDGIRAAACMR